MTILLSLLIVAAVIAALVGLALLGAYLTLNAGGPSLLWEIKRDSVRYNNKLGIPSAPGWAIGRWPPTEEELNPEAKGQRALEE